MLESFTVDILPVLGLYPLVTVVGGSLLLALAVQIVRVVAAAHVADDLLHEGRGGRGRGGAPPGGGGPHRGVEGGVVEDGDRGGGGLRPGARHHLHHQPPHPGTADSRCYSDSQLDTGGQETWLILSPEHMSSPTSLTK